MWVYGQKRLSERLELDPMVGYWLDYWLFLHMETTHSIWSTRPIGLKALAGMALSGDRVSDAALRRSLKREMVGLREWLPFVPSIPSPPEGDLTVDGTAWSHKRKAWFERVVSDVKVSDVVAALSMAVAREIKGGNLNSVAYFTRKLGEQASDDEESSELRVSFAVEEFLGQTATLPSRTNEDDLAQRIFRAIIPTLEFANYAVRCNVTPVIVSRTKVGAGLWRNLVVQQKSSSAYELTGLQVSVTASNMKQASAKAMDFFTRTIETLRINHYLQTNIYGKLELETKGAKLQSALPEPFWSSEYSPRKVPHIPLDYDAILGKIPKADHPTGERERWQGARWHLSSVFQKWPEDVHGAAAHVWYAIEAFFGTQPSLLAETYQRCVVPELISIFANSVSVQRKLLLMGPRKDCDWSGRDQDREDALSWLRAVTGERYPRSHRFWKRPEAPSLLFDSRVGLLFLLKRANRSGQFGTGIAQRLRADLELLYVLRNKVAHEGRYLFPRQLAEYLGKLGLEIVLSCMSDAHARLKTLMVLPDKNEAKEEVPIRRD